MSGHRRKISFDLLKKLVPHGEKDLTPEQRRMYASEEATNFRTIAKLCATRSSYVLGKADLTSPELHAEISVLGQFAELAYAVLEPEFVFEHLDVLSKSGFPLEGFDALPGTRLVSSFKGHTADLPGYVAYRTDTRQLVVAFSGTTTVQQAFFDLCFRKRKHPAGKGCSVHSGFWKLYKGCRPQTLEGIKKGLEEYNVEEVVITGHSLGGAMSLLLALDLMTMPSVDGVTLPLEVRLKVVGYGSPRVGNAKLAKVWQSALQAQSEKGRVVQEYLVKAYNDGVPALPPAKFGYRHFTSKPMYFYHGRLFHVPQSECEHGVFDVEEEAAWSTQLRMHPRGGHNYYNGRDLERTSRRMQWISDMMGGGTEWENKYLARLQEEERKWRHGKVIKSELNSESSGPSTRS